MAKVTLTFKTPDVDTYVVDDERQRLNYLVEDGELTQDQADEQMEEFKEKLDAAIEKFFEYREYARIEIDLDTLTAVILPKK